ncbi:MAG: hypothetical protein JO235_04970 [Chroococcidiopsidaceae cyanobacterium CP_BM_RX_35]|nr:hypothetical protein [Chroococcidiopsidaceae cyanobacterium CP_BM_RX_35]
MELCNRNDECDHPCLSCPARLQPDAKFINQAAEQRRLVYTGCSLYGDRQHLQRPAILKLLVLVFEQLRDTGKAVAFLRAYVRLVPDDAWATEKLEKFTALGVC